MQYIVILFSNYDNTLTYYSKHEKKLTLSLKWLLRLSFVPKHFDFWQIIIIYILDDNIID